MNKLQQLRKNKNLSQNDLANITGLSKRQLQHYEQGSCIIDGAGLDKLVPLALALECKISDILEDSQLIEMCLKLGI